MSFRNGYLGAMILLIAVVATILGSWVLSLDVTEKTVTNYEYVTELTGLFDTEQAPAYTEYNPSTNFTGYYTDQNTKYFDGVTYTPSNQRNAYRLNLAPSTITTAETIDLSETSGGPQTWKFYYWTSNDSHHDGTIEYLTVADLITANHWETFDDVTLISNFTSWTSGGFITFCSSSMLDVGVHALDADHTLTMKNPLLTGELVLNSLIGNTVNASDILNPVLSCRYDAETGYAELFYDQNMERSLGPFTPDDVYIVWSTSTSSSFHLGHEVVFTGTDYPDPQYMDIRQGVKVE